MKSSKFKNSTPQYSLCEFCSSLNFLFICSRDDESQVVNCLNCDLVFVNPLPDQNHLNAINKTTSQNKQSKTLEAFLKISQNKHKGLDAQEKNDMETMQLIEAQESLKARYRKRFKLIERFSFHKGKLLDLGCGEGHFLKHASLQGWDVSGIDLKAENTEFAKKVLQIKNVHCAPLGEVLLPEKTFNVVTLYDLIEHLSNPFSELKKINKLLQPRGLVVISTPNVKNSIFMKERWTGYIVKGHIYFFSKKTLTQMLQRAGFKVIFSKTENAKKGLLVPKESLPGKIRIKPKSLLGRFWYSVKRDLRNTFNPINYIGPLFSICGYGFNLIVVARKDSSQ